MAVKQPCSARFHLHAGTEFTEKTLKISRTSRFAMTLTVQILCNKCCGTATGSTYCASSVDNADDAQQHHVER